MPQPVGDDQDSSHTEEIILGVDTLWSSETRCSS